LNDESSGAIRRKRASISSSIPTRKRRAPRAHGRGPDHGLPIATAPAEAVDLGSIAIKVDPPLTDVRMADVLNAIVTVAETPIKYSIEDYAVVFSLKGAETTPLFTRTFKVNPNTFYQGLEAVGAFAFDIQTSGGQGGGGGGGGGAAAAAVAEHFAVPVSTWPGVLKAVAAVVAAVVAAQARALRAAADCVSSRRRCAGVSVAVRIFITLSVV
jgi:hypothetical protein